MKGNSKFTKIIKDTAAFIDNAFNEVGEWFLNVLKEQIDLITRLSKKESDIQKRYYLSSKLFEVNWFMDLIKRGPDLYSKRRPLMFHKYHILDPSPWPFMVPFGVVTMMLGFVIYVHTETEELSADSSFLWLGLLQTLICSFLWWDDVVYESEEHTEEVRKGLKMGMLLFIVSEVMFFFSFFWAFFHLSLSPSVEMGSIWPPIELGSFLVNPYKIPLANTIILLTSGVTITYVHHQLNWLTAWTKESFFLIKLRLFLINIKQQVAKKKKIESLKFKCGRFYTFFRKMSNFKRINISVLKFLITKLRWRDIASTEITLKGGMEQRKRVRNKGRIVMSRWGINSCLKYLKEQFSIITLFSAMKQDYLEFLAYTLGLAVAFTVFQVGEYLTCEINLSDGAYGSTFYLLTGFHGFHVIIGSIFILVCFIRAFYGHFEDGKYIGLECAIWYWHFVDVVWLFLYIFVYIWSSTTRVVGINAQLEVETMADMRELAARGIDTLSGSDFAANGQIFFQDPASFVMENIISLHNYVMVFLILIFSVVIWFFFTILNKYKQKKQNLFEELNLSIDQTAGRKKWLKLFKVESNYINFLRRNKLDKSDDLIGALDYQKKEAKVKQAKKPVKRVRYSYLIKKR